MSNHQTLSERLSTRRPLVMDGALNTELARRGLLFDTTAWLEVSLRSPETIAEVHASYARAGAQLHIANSFASARHVLERAGLGERFEPLNRAAVEVCRRAIDEAAPHQQWIAGSLSTFAAGHDRGNLPEVDVLERNFTEQGHILADAGCDMLALEMLYDVDTSLAMLRGAARSGLPTSIGLVCVRRGDAGVMLHGSGRHGLRGMPDVALDEALPRILDALPGGTQLIVAVMHSAVEDTGPALEVVRAHWDGDVAVYPNIGHYAPPGGWDTSNGCSPERFADAGEGWLRRGASIVGGCCGTGPEHIRALGQRLGQVLDHGAGPA